jgi:hypothetical protein
MASPITDAAHALARGDHRVSPFCATFVERPRPAASTVTTVSARSTTALRKVGERIVQSTMTVTVSFRDTGLCSCDNLMPGIER